MMKQTCFIFFSLVLLGSCKTGLSNRTLAKADQPQVVKTDTVYPPITLFNIVYDSTWLNDTEQLTKLTKSLNHLFHEHHRVTKDEKTLKRRLDYVKDKSFPKVLAKDFENDAFTKATNVHFSFIADNDESKMVTVEEWFFKDEGLANSCFNSLESYRQRDIHFLFFSWIWVQQKNKLFLINSSRYQVDTKPIRTIKEHLLTILQDNGKYRVIEVSI